MLPIFLQSRTTCLAFLWNHQLEIIVRLVDIHGIVDHHYLNSVFIIKICMSTRHVDFNEHKKKSLYPSRKRIKWRNSTFIAFIHLTVTSHVCLLTIDHLHIPDNINLTWSYTVISINLEKKLPFHANFNENNIIFS